MTRTRVFITDDHAVFRDGIRLLINAQPDMEVVGEAGDSREGLARARELQPDVMVLDVSMPGGSGIQLIEKLREDCPGMRVLVLSMHDDATFLRAALAAGAAGYVVKSSASAGLLTGIRDVAAGGTFVDAHFAQQRTAPETSGVIPSGADTPKPLSRRELEVLRHLAHGYTNQQVAEKLSLSTKTVEAHRARIYQKLGLRSRADLVRYAMGIGILGPGAGGGSAAPPTAD